MCLHMQVHLHVHMQVHLQPFYCALFLPLLFLFRLFYRALGFARRLFGCGIHQPLIEKTAQ